jgi:exopolysaccharide biosynthesis polyprenyl glycosylphosphotransferase
VSDGSPQAEIELRLGGLADGEATVERGALVAERPALRTRSVPPIGVIPPARRDTLFRRLLAVADMVAALAGLLVVGAFTGRGIPTLTLIAVPLIVVMAKVAGRYDHDEVVLRKSTLDEAPALFALSAVFALAWSGVAFLSNVQLQLGGAGVVVLWASTGAFLVLARAAARSLARAAAPPERALIVGDAEARAKVTQSLQYDPGARVEVVGYLPLEEDHSADGRLGFEELEAAVHRLGVERVMLVPTVEHFEDTLELVRRVAAAGLKVSIVPRLLDVVGSAVEFDAVGDLTVLGVRRPGLSRSSRLVKRAMDVAGSAVGLLVLAPFGLVVALAIKLDSPGPVFFRQARVGRDARSFWMIKFRSMVDGAERQRQALEELNESRGLFKLSHDPRVTRVGRWLRAFSLDELPQLINVLRGEMSLVGPRPLVIDEDALVEGWHRDRLLLTPGMTGPWQVLGPQRPPLQEMVKVDYLYAANWSIWNDIKILLRTLSHVLGRRGI